MAGYLSPPGRSAVRIMKISDMKAIMEIVQTRSMSKTAEHLFITQSALSQLLARVEAELDAPLFYRTPGKSLELSDVGKQFYRMAKEVTGTYDAFLHGLRTRPLTIGISMRVGKYLIEAMQNAIPNFSPEHYTFSELPLMEREMSVLNHSVDLAFSRLPIEVSPVSYFVIRRDPIGIYLRKGSPKAALARPKENSKYAFLPISVLDGEPLCLPGNAPRIRKAAEDALQKYHVKPSVIIDVKSMSYMFQMVNNGVYNCLYAKPIPEVSNVSFYWIEDCDITYDLAILYDKDTDRKSEIEELCQIMRRYYEMNPDLP